MIYLNAINDIYKILEKIAMEMEYYMVYNDCPLPRNTMPRSRGLKLFQGKAGSAGFG